MALDLTVFSAETSVSVGAGSAAINMRWDF